MCVQLNNLWGWHMLGINLFDKWAPHLYFLNDFHVHISHFLTVSLTHLPIQRFPSFHLYCSYLLLSLSFFFSISILPWDLLSVAVWLNKVFTTSLDPYLHYERFNDKYYFDHLFDHWSIPSVYLWCKCVSCDLKISQQSKTIKQTIKLKHKVKLSYL